MKHVLFQSFGLNIDANQTLIENKIQEIEENFDLVMIQEEFETSIILLKELLNWSYDDLKSLDLNTRMQDSKQFVSNDTRSKMKDVYIPIFTVFILQLEKNFKDNDQLKKHKQVILIAIWLIFIVLMGL